MNENSVLESAIHKDPGQEPLMNPYNDNVTANSGTIIDDNNNVGTLSMLSRSAVEEPPMLTIVTAKAKEASKAVTPPASSVSRLKKRKSNKPIKRVKSTMQHKAVLPLQLAVKPELLSPIRHYNFHNKVLNLLENEAMNNINWKIMGEENYEESQLKKVSLKDQKRTYLRKKSFKCPDCFKLFTSHYNLVTHYRIHDGEKPFECSECSQAFSQKSNLKNHQRIHTGEKPFKCSECSNSFALKGTLVKHQRAHTEEKQFHCTECPKSYKNRESLKQHERIHTGEKPYQCHLCSKSFRDRSSLKAHLRSHERSKRKRSKLTKREKNAQQQIVAAPVQPMVKPELIENQSLVQPMEPVQLLENPELVVPQLPVVKQEMSSRMKKMTPLSLFNPLSLKKNYSHFWENEVKDNNNLEVDKEEDIFGDSELKKGYVREKSYECTDCLKSFTSNSNLVNHQRIHTGEKPFECSECAKVFSQKTNLKNHEKTHTGEKPFKCSECSNSFTLKGNLVRHQRTHTGDKPFHCTECSKSFAQRDTLKQHQKLHSEEKSYECAMCARSFFQRSCLQKHNKIHHSGETPKIKHQVVSEAL